MGLLLFFYQVAAHMFWYNYSLLCFAFVVGLLGGAVYVATFVRIAAEMPPRLKELALGSASIADTVGIIFADIMGLSIQACIYELHGIPGATATCWL